MKKCLQKAYEITNAKISFVSLVDKPANKRTFLMKKADDGKATFTTYGRIIKADEKSHFVTGIVYEPLQEDSQGNYMTEEEITKAAYWFAKNSNKVDLQHSFESLDSAAVVESWITKADFEIDGEMIHKGTWLITVEVADEKVWDSIQKGDITGFSMGGLGTYSEEDITLSEEVSKVAEKSGQKKGLLKQLASAFGFDVVEKGTLAELYEQKSKGALFWEAFNSVQSTLRHYDVVTEQYVYETDETKIREVLEDFGNIITSLLAGSEPIAKAIQTDQPVEKAGKAMSSKNLETLCGIRDSLDMFLKSFDPEDEPEDVGEHDKDNVETKNSEEETKNNVKKEEDTMTKHEVETIVSETVAKAMEGYKVEHNDSLTAEKVEKMVEEAVAKAVEPVLKSRGLPSNLDDSVKVEKAEEHYLHGFI